MILLLLTTLIGCNHPPEYDVLWNRKGGWIPVPSPNGYTNVECYVWDDPVSISYNGPICLHACSTK